MGVRGDAANEEVLSVVERVVVQWDEKKEQDRLHED